MLPLIDTVDDGMATVGPGKEIHVEFPARRDQTPTEWTRRYVLETNGWWKDMDLFTRDGNTVTPFAVEEFEKQCHTDLP